MSNLLGLGNEDPQGQTAVDAGLAVDPNWATLAKNGANWFYWIAGLSLINSAAFIAGASFHFLAGLGLTEMADAIVSASITQGAPEAVKAFSILFDGILIIGFGITGYFANKLVRTAFVIGIVVYVVDSVVVLFIGDYFSAAFHIFALIFIIRGFLACRQIKAFEAATLPLPPPPPPQPAAL